MTNLCETQFLMQNTPYQLVIYAMFSGYLEVCIKACLSCPRFLGLIPFISVPRVRSSFTQRNIDICGTSLIPLHAEVTPKPTLNCLNQIYCFSRNRCRQTRDAWSASEPWFCWTKNVMTPWTRWYLWDTCNNAWVITI